MTRRSEGSLGWSGALIVRVLRAFPPDFRRDYGPDLLNAFLDQRQDVADATRSRLLRAAKVAGTTLVTSANLLHAAVAERRASTRRRQADDPKRKPHMLETLVADLKYAVRGHLRQPAVAAIAVVTLALGIGANAAVFSVLNGVLLRDLPYEQPDRLLDVQVNSGIVGGPEWYGASDPEFLDFGSQVESFAQVAAYTGSEVTIGDSTAPRRVRIIRASAELLPMLGVPPLLGRFFTPEEDQPGPVARPAVGRALVLSHGLWQTDFGGDPDVVGRTITVQGEPVAIVGVMPSGFEFPDTRWQAWTPMQMDRADPWYRNNHYLNVTARLAPGHDIGAAQSELDLLAARSTEAFPDYYPDPGYRVRLRPFSARIVGSVSTPLYVLMGAVAFVLLTACVNVASVLLARGEARKRELAIRSAVGASTSRVTRQLLTENFLLAAAGGIAGVLVAVLGVRALLAMAPDSLPRLNHIGIDGTVLGFSTAVAVLTGIVFGLLPALRAAKPDAGEVLKEGGRHQGGGRASQALRRTLVAAQVALAVLLVTGAGLMLRSVIEMYQVDTGFSTENTITFDIYPSSLTYDTPESGVALYRELMERLGAVPGVTSAAATAALPLAGNYGRWSLVIEGQPAPTIADAPAEWVEHVTPSYFEAMGMTLVRGRTFTDADRVDARAVTVINESMASTHWPGEDPVGKRFRVFGGSNPPWMEVVGVVKDVRHRAVNRVPEARWYAPHAQGYVSSYVSPLSMTIVVRGGADPTALMPSLRSEIASIDGSIPISRIQTMEQVFAEAVAGERFVTVLLVVFGVVALLLAAVGVYGVISYAVSQRTHEIGIRVALGATGGWVLAHVVREGLLLTAVGVSVGVIAAVALSRGMASMVFGVTPTDPATYVAVVVVLSIAATAASLLPAWRASRVSPMLALREET